MWLKGGLQSRMWKPCPGPGGTPYYGLYGHAVAERGYLFQASGIWKGREFTG